MEQKTLFIHRRDLRLIDNTALNEARKQGNPVIGCFILNPEQVEEQPYRSSNAIQFMVASLQELQEEYEERGGRLHIFYGDPAEVVEQLIQEEGVRDIYFNKDYTPFSKKRDERIVDVAKKYSVSVHQYDDALLTAPGEVCKDDGTPYSVFTPFFKKAFEIEIPKLASLEQGTFYAQNIASSYKGSLEDCIPGKNAHILLQGGRKEGLRLIRELEDIKKYKDERDFPYKKKTSHLSAHHKFGTVSIRETYWGAKAHMSKREDFIRELYWRDFYTHLAYHFPHVFEGAFMSQYQDVKWDWDEEKFDAWKDGKTGFPIVDAGMRELKETGYMHNRVRMIVASFLTKDLHISWQWGERYFATQLTDYDPCVNNGSWQWAASTGADAAPYFRIFNPWLQQKKFDPDAQYIKKWVPELADASPEEIHKGDTKRISLSYREPMLDHKKEAEEAKRRFAEKSK